MRSTVFGFFLSFFGSLLLDVPLFFFPGVTFALASFDLTFFSGACFSCEHAALDSS